MRVVGIESFGGRVEAPAPVGLLMDSGLEDKEFFDRIRTLIAEGWTLYAVGTAAPSEETTT